LRVLQNVVPSREQLPLVANDRPGVAVIHGAAGSGKTTTALLRLKQLCVVRRSRRLRLGDPEPVRVLVLTYNRSLAGYVAQLAQQQVPEGDDLELTVCTFGKWSASLLDLAPLLSDVARANRIEALGRPLRLSRKFLAEEVDYAFGRFPASNINEYTVRDRDGRGSVPRVDKQRMLTEVLIPYRDGKQADRKVDWNDVAESVARLPQPRYDVIVIDEAQDFSANQVRAVLAHLAPEGSLTFVMDTVQRIYPRYFTWREVGLDASQFVLNERLVENRRNTIEIAAFARPLVEGLPVDENGQLPDLTSAREHGPIPVLFGGRFSQQARYIIEYISTVDLSMESVGILHPAGGGWFDYLREELHRADIPFVELSLRSNWPTGPVNVGLSTLHSAKGLEFDHVIICGITGETTVMGTEEDDSARLNLRRLVAMGVGRARTGFALTHDPAAPSDILRYLDPTTYRELGGVVRR
jgi:superfamily I DNA/RNA helicase